MSDEFDEFDEELEPGKPARLKPAIPQEALEDEGSEPGKAAGPGPAEEALEGFFEELRRQAEALKSRYPLSMTPEECLGLEYRGPDDYRLASQYFNDSYRDGEYTLYEDPGRGRSGEVLEAFKAGRTCPVCRGDWFYKAVYRGTKTNFFFPLARTCMCSRYKWMKEKVDSKLPPALRQHKLDLLKPSELSRLPLSRQAEEIGFMKAHRDESFFFLGPPGSSKSTFAAALFRAAIWRDALRGMGGFQWRVDGNHLFETEVAYAMADDKQSARRDVTVEDIVLASRKKFRPVLLLEEIDKRKMTEFAANVLFRLANALDEAGGQLILTTNLSKQGFRDMFLKSDIDAVRVDGAAILRRVFEKANVRDYFDGK
jgi:DNA replication protein DnaC